MVGRRKKKTSQGRKKIAIEKIASEDARHVCFSKRRNGVFTKATDLATLCGAEVAIVVNSPAGNPYSFGSPGVNELATRFLSGGTVPSGSTGLHNEHRMNLVRELNLQCMELSRRMEIGNAKKFVLEARLKDLVEKNPICKLADEVEGLELPQLKQVEKSLRGLKGRVEGRMNELMRRSVGSSIPAMSSNPLRMLNQFTLGSSQAGFNNHLGYGHGFYQGTI